MYGSIVNDLVGFRLTADIAALICLVFGLTYLFVGGGMTALKTTYANIKQSKKVDNKYEYQLSKTSYST